VTEVAEPTRGAARLLIVRHSGCLMQARRAPKSRPRGIPVRNHSGPGEASPARVYSNPFPTNDVLPVFYAGIEAVSYAPR
jgi:hypothetical protein